MMKGTTSAISRTSAVSPGVSMMVKVKSLVVREMISHAPPVDRNAATAPAFSLNNAFIRDVFPTPGFPSNNTVKLVFDMAYGKGKGKGKTG